MASKTMSPPTIKPLLPPEDSMWQRYSPHYELPLASATSIFLHGLILGIMAVGGIAFFFSLNQEAARPPRMDVVMIEGGGTGFEGLGGEPGLPGAPDAGAKTEQITPQTDQPPTEPRPQSLLPKDTPPELDLPMIDDGKAPLGSELAIELAKIAKDADEQVKKSMDVPKTLPVPSGQAPKKVGTGNPKGQGGLGGPGGGTGMGSKQGAGVGMGGPGGGRVATKQEIFAWRWRFDLSGDGKEHARKAAAVGFTMAIPDPKSGFHIITDLNRRPVEMQKDNLTAYKDAVKWSNVRPDSVQALARELQLPFVPKFVVLLLPKEREEKMAAEEAQYAKDHRRDLRKVTATWFDFRLRNGVYDPVVIRQE